MPHVPTDPPAPRLIIVLQMGKVASWTVIRTIQEAKEDIRLCTLEDSLESDDAIVHLHDPLVFKAYLEKTKDIARDINVITLVRDPLRNAIAGLFQNLAEPGHSYYRGSVEDVNRLSGEELVEVFRSIAQEPLQYFEDYTADYGSALGIDAYNLSYDKSGTAFGSFALGRYIVIRVHRLADALPVLSDMLSIDLKRIYSDNVGADKWYAAAYDRFMAAFHPTDAEIDAFYRSRFARANFAQSEIDQFIDSWPKSET